MLDVTQVLKNQIAELVHGNAQLIVENQRLQEEINQLKEKDKADASDL